MSTDSPDVEWIAQECADYLGIKLRTWHSYVKRPGKRNPAPQPVRMVGRTPVWLAGDVKAWAATRTHPAVVDREGRE